MEPALGIFGGGKAVPAREKLGAFFFANFDVGHDGAELLLVDGGPHVNGGVEAIADLQFSGALNKTGDKFLIDAFVHTEAAGSSAALAGSAESAPDRAVNRQIEIGIVHHQNNIFAAHLQAVVFETGGANFRNDPAG